MKIATRLCCNFGYPFRKGLSNTNVWQATTNKTDLLQSDGAFMLGNDQDCYGGCTDSTQAFYGLMDEVRSLC